MPMDDSLLTKCPHCKTLFRIKHEHLAAANGEVRCGVCFKVFNARSEGISYGESDAPEPPQQESGRQQETSREQATQIINRLELPKPLQKARTEATSSPRREEIEQLQLGQESVETFIATPASPKLDRPWLWGTLCGAALLLLAAQWAWFHIDKYATDQRWRPWYSAACQYLPCSLPEFIAIEKIRTERLTVKSHTEFSNVLVVDLIISNHATWPQPMPALDLAFYDINGAVLVSRLLQPGEYLSRTLSLKQMPVGTPIHLSFSIMDPGPEAVNYGVQLAANPNS